MSESDQQNRERCRLAFEANEILHTLEKCMSKLRNGFADIHEYHEVCKTIERLNGETKELYADVVEKLDVRRDDNGHD